ncbi:MotA/TolQ/ExbB proton channel family protein [Photobacterium aquimaris]|uniref:MotA/TolQ/ExbB proton channel family protein n=1 Tax=Photobacterium aquimaris TaxID=512643 RepID=A0A2T3HTS4_9GAMM|nr:MotA/TolQ/ExbB proton channel family protein [Photobacterium aquimaris]OBU23744.1 flagellar motor protein MotA [Photobacterium aquimaris]PQJ38703.1 flagellar motor protein MotA [Photobacterium aquimaris]PST98816.1 MotA/TolQ/ExbB proton channel family protein [Photobacterium aquimaris]
MKLKALVAALCVASMPFAVNAESVVKQAQQEQKQQTQHNIQREAGFNHTQQTVKAQYDALVAERNKLKAATEVLSTTFSTNEQHLSTLEQQLRLESGSLGELFGVVRQTAKEVQSEQQHAVTAIDNSQDNAVVNDIVAAKALPSMVQLQGLWQAMTDQIVASGQIAKVSVPYINGDGEQSNVEALRLGSIGLVGDNGYLRWDGSQHVAMAYLQQPEHAPTLANYDQLVSTGNQMLVVDPSRGVMLEQLAQSPTLMDRLQAGGAVGKVILLLLAIGAGIAIFRGTKLVLIRQQIKAQLKQPSKPGNNPLGRVLAVYNKEQSRSVEALELRLLEAIVDEQQGLEKGLSMLKLFAALAPMLGLLGTVTGMIETFQVITQFGNGDPKVMAGGISMALVTTVLGLVAAMPLLLAHNILSSQAENIRMILEKQGISLVAEQAEKNDNNGIKNSGMTTEQAA